MTSAKGGKGPASSSFSFHVPIKPFLFVTSLLEKPLYFDPFKKTLTLLTQNMSETAFFTGMSVII